MSELAIKDAEEELVVDKCYELLQMRLCNMVELYDYRYITSRSTEENVKEIENVCQNIQRICKECTIPVEGAFLRKTITSVQMYKCLLCNTSFGCQSLLNEDSNLGYIVDIHPPFSPYLFIEIVWYLNYENVLTESILHFPLDLCVEILEILPRCLEVLEPQRALKFLCTLVSNTYKKFQILKDRGTQSQDVSRYTKKLAGNLQELILQLSNDRFFVLKKPLKLEQQRRFGMYLKTLVQLVRTCLTSRSKEIQLPADMQEKYNLTFGDLAIVKIDDPTLQACLKEVDYELISLLMKKVKEVDCNMYMNWTEFDDEANTSLTLQKALGLEVYSFIESTKEFKERNIQEYNHLIECLRHISSKPDPENSLQCSSLSDLCSGVQEGRKDCLVNLIHRYKEWDDTVIDVIDSNVFLLGKLDLPDLFEYVADELNRPSAEIALDNLQICISSLAKAILHLKVVEVYELTVQSILKFGDAEKPSENVLDVSSFEKFLMTNSNLSNAQNLSIALFHLCFSTREALKILLKMTIGHSDYPDVAVSLDDLMLLLPVLKIRIYSKRGDLVEALKVNWIEKRVTKTVDERMQNKFYVKSKHFDDNDLKTTNLALSVLQEIYIEGSGWNVNKMSSLIQYLYTFCTVAEVVEEVFIPYLLQSKYELDYLKYALLELLKVNNEYKSNASKNYYLALTKPGVYLFDDNNTSRYVIDELLTMIFQLFQHRDGKHNDFLLEVMWSNKNFHQILFFRGVLCESLSRIIDFYVPSYQVKILVSDTSGYPLQLATEDMLRHFFLKCTRLQFLKGVDNIVDQFHKILKWQGNIHMCDHIIRLTFENCLICLEYPHVSPPDSISFFIRNLMLTLPTIQLNSKRVRQLCQFLDKHVAILKPSIEHTAIYEAYTKLQKLCRDSIGNFAAYQDAYEEFAFGCTQENEKLKTFDAPHSPLGIKLWLVYDIVCQSIDEDVTGQEMLKNLGEYFKDMKVC